MKPHHLSRSFQTDLVDLSRPGSNIPLHLPPHIKQVRRSIRLPEPLCQPFSLRHDKIEPINSQSRTPAPRSRRLFDRQTSLFDGINMLGPNGIQTPDTLLDRTRPIASSDSKELIQKQSQRQPILKRLRTPLACRGRHGVCRISNEHAPIVAPGGEIWHVEERVDGVDCSGLGQALGDHRVCPAFVPFAQGLCHFLRVWFGAAGWQVRVEE